ncbi:MAG: SCO family protein [Pseudomonadota bacterium]
MSGKITQIIAIVGLVMLLAWLLLFWEPDGSGAGSSLTTAPAGGDFSLQSADGPVNLREMRGKVVVLYFGYTFCPDVCPTSLSLLSATLHELTAEELRQVQVIFVSVDPERDTLDHLKTYAGYFHDNLIGATGSREQIDDAASKYGVGYNIIKNESEADYSVDHTSYTYIIDKNGRLRFSLNHGTDPEEVSRTIRSLL